MKRVVFLFLLLTTLGLIGTAQEVPALSNLLSNPGFEGHEPVSGGDVAGLVNFSGWTEGGKVRSANPEQARIQVQIGSQDRVIVSISDLPISWNVSGDDYWSDWFLVSGSMDLEGELSPDASMDISFQSDGDSLSNPPFTRLFVDNAFAGAAGNDADPNDVPEPDMMMLLGSGLLALAGIGRRFTRT